MFANLDHCLAFKVHCDLYSGCTWEFGAMVGHIRRSFPQTQLVVVGFSLGGNIVCKFLGENQSNQDGVLCCISICQGYSALRLVDWTTGIYTLGFIPTKCSMLLASK